MTESIFRRKSIDKLSSPESVNEYIKVANPSVWVFLVAVIILMCGVLFWGIYGQIGSSVELTVSSDGNNSFCYVCESDISKVEGISDIIIGDYLYGLGDIPQMPIELTKGNDSYLLHVMNIPDSSWVYMIPLKENPPKGVYKVRANIEGVAPISFIIN